MILVILLLELLKLQDKINMSWTDILAIAVGYKVFCMMLKNWANKMKDAVKDLPPGKHKVKGWVVTIPEKKK